MPESRIDVAERLVPSERTKRAWARPYFLASALLERWGQPDWSDGTIAEASHEAGLLRLAIGKARERPGWRPVWDFDATVARTADWYAAVLADPARAREACLADLQAYCAEAAEAGLPWTR